MTARERFLHTLRDGAVGCPPLHERLIREEVETPWHAQGLPAGTDLGAHFKIDRWQAGGLSGAPALELRPSPPLEHVVRTPDDVPGWYAGHQGDRYAADWAEQVAALRGRDWPLGLSVTRGLFQTFGVTDGDSLVDHLYFLADHPDLAEAMLDHLAGWLSRHLTRAAAELDLDYLTLDEPVASQHGPVIGPATFRRFLTPFYRRLVAAAREAGIPLVIWVSYGQVKPLLPEVLETGVDALWLNQAPGSGIDYRRLREQLGPAIGLIGGIDARCLLHGEDAIVAELESRLPPLLAAGRYAPMLDDRVRPNVPLEAFTVYRRRLAELVA